MRRPSHIVIVAAAAVVLSGCGILFPSRSQRAARENPDFQAGYSDGCAAANQQDTNYRREMTRDESLYRTNKNYRTGWGSGFYNCHTNLSHDPTQAGVGPIPDNSPGGKTY
jgi:hypothetical protein